MNYTNNAGNPVVKKPIVCKLNVETVRRIRELYDNGKGDYTQTQLAKMFNIAKSQVWRIVHNDQWKNA